ncbi:uncharacterized protein LOC123542832 [Mercenaria mercenaria]|uniref:uncharacterized protein LOC123542832 n=1 Tax=Mercenaria mercenaria TaxID=6596 RepID=UPI001E1E1549|nr:uncharacterized protein LOC123542832 [Mercenaria mercenaria]
MEMHDLLVVLFLAYGLTLAAGIGLQGQPKLKTYTFSIRSDAKIGDVAGVFKDIDGWVQHGISGVEASFFVYNWFHTDIKVNRNITGQRDYWFNMFETYEFKKVRTYYYSTIVYHIVHVRVV